MGWHRCSCLFASSTGRHASCSDCDCHCTWPALRPASACAAVPTALPLCPSRLPDARLPARPASRLLLQVFWPEGPHFLRPLHGRYTFSNLHALGVENVLCAWVRPQVGGLAAWGGCWPPRLLAVPAPGARPPHARAWLSRSGSSLMVRQQYINSTSAVQSSTFIAPAGHRCVRGHERRRGAGGCGGGAA